MSVVSDVVVGLVIDALTIILRGVLINIDIGALVDVNTNVLADVMTAFDFSMPDPIEGFRC